jgi:PAS domain S-box-containing protein
MQKPPIPDNEQARLAALKKYKILDTLREESFDRITRTASTAIHAPIALISLVDTNRQWFKSTCGLDASETSREVSFCAHTLEKGEPLIVGDAHQDPRFHDNPLVSGNPHIRFYAGFPLKTQDNFILGTLCVIDTKPKVITEQEKQMLQDLAYLVMDELEFRLHKLKIEEDLEETQYNYDTLLRDTHVLTSVLDHTVDAIFTTTANGLIESLNDSGETIFGFKDSELIGQPIETLFPVHYQRNQTTNIEHYFYSRKGQTTDTGYVELIGYRKDGSTFPAELSVTEVDLGDRTIFTGIARDITERVEARTELLEALAVVKQASEAKSIFLSRLSHELRTPLNAIIGFSELLSFEALQDEHMDSVQMIHESGKHLLMLINEILDLAMIEKGTIVMNMEKLALRPILNLIQNIVTPQLNMHDVSLEVKPVDDDLIVTADPVRLRQVLLNLVSNAIKYNQKGGSVYLDVSVTEANVRIDVTDTGEGFDMKYSDALFEPFNRLGKESTAIEGTGIGLPISKELMHLMGGEIGVTSEIGHGSTFWVALQPS